MTRASGGGGVGCKKYAPTKLSQTKKDAKQEIMPIINNKSVPILVTKTNKFKQIQGTIIL